MYDLLFVIWWGICWQLIASVTVRLLLCPSEYHYIYLATQEYAWTACGYHVQYMIKIGAFDQKKSRFLNTVMARKSVGSQKSAWPERAPGGNLSEQ